MKFKVYVDYTKEPDSRPFYVGKGSEGRVRDFKRNDLHESIAKKYGIDRRVEFETDDEQEAFEKERELIARYRTFMNHEPGQWEQTLLEAETELLDGSLLKKFERKSETIKGDGNTQKNLRAPSQKLRFDCTPVRKDLKRHDVN